MYKVASTSEYGIEDINMAEKAWILPGQTSMIFDVSPVNYTFEVQAMSAEKLPFIFSTVFTIGPCVDDVPSLHKYAKLISRHDNVKELVQGIIEGETRFIAALMTMEEVFRGTKEFKQEVFEKVQLELNKFGLLIYNNANVKQLVDVPGHEYLMEARVDVAEARMKLREAEVVEANAELVKKKAQVAELQKEVERLNALTRTEKLKPQFLSKASVHYETKVQELVVPQQVAASPSAAPQQVAASLPATAEDVDGCCGPVKRFFASRGNDCLCNWAPQVFGLLLRIWDLVIACL